MDRQQPTDKPGVLRAPAFWAGAAVLVVMALVVVLVAALSGSGNAGTPVWQTAPSASEAPVAPSPSPSPAAERLISLSATGDIIMGNAPNRLPARGGKGFFDGVREALAADLVMGNLEEPLTEDTGFRKCAPDSTACHQFRAPPGYAAHLRDAGFEVLNQANNHGHDYGPEGYRNTQKALEEHGLRHTGAPGQITVVDVEGVSVAVVGFSAYAWSNPLNDIDAAKEIVGEAAGQADVVVVQVHMGAEGADETRVRPGNEIFYGENRGDPIRFSHAVIDAGADLVVGHGPHVLRGLEVYEGRLIAYSLGNFAGGARTLNNSGRLGWGAVLKVSLRPDGTFVHGEFISTYMNGAGKPVVDERDRGLALVTELTGKDFPETGPKLAEDGTITPP